MFRATLHKSVILIGVGVLGLFLSAFASHAGSGPHAEELGIWKRHVNTNDVDSLAVEGDYLWQGSSWGLVRRNIVTGEVKEYPLFANNLADTRILSLVIDEAGNKWFGRADGLWKFDGRTWTTFTTENSGLVDNWVISIAIDHQARLWLGTGGGVSVFDGASWTSYTPTNSGLPDASVYTVSIDHAGNIWFGTIGGGVARFDGTNWTDYTESNSELVSNYIRSSAVDNGGNVWFGSSFEPNVGGRGVSMFDGTTWTSYQYEIPGWTTTSFFDIAVDENNHIWFATDRGAIKFDGTEWSQYWDASTSGAPDISHAVVVDREGNKWFGEQSAGVTKFDGTNWTNYQDIEPNDDAVSDIVADKDGNVWIGTARGLNLFTGRDWIEVPLYDNQFDVPILDLAVDSKGNLWTQFGGHPNDIAIYDGRDWTVIQEVSEHNIDDIACDNIGRCWLGALVNLILFDGSNWTTYDQQNSGLPDGRILDVITDNDNRVWSLVGGWCDPQACGELSVLAVFDGTSWITYTPAEGLPETDIRDMAFDSDGNLWLATAEGATVFDGITWTTYTPENSGLMDVPLSSVAIDDNGNKWFGSPTGIAIFDGLSWSYYSAPEYGNIQIYAIDERGDKWFFAYEAGLLQLLDEAGQTYIPTITR